MTSPCGHDASDTAPGYVATIAGQMEVSRILRDYGHIVCERCEIRRTFKLDITGCLDCCALRRLQADRDRSLAEMQTAAARVRRYIETGSHDSPPCGPSLLKRLLKAIAAFWRKLV